MEPTGMPQPTISAELVRQLRHRLPVDAIDYRDAKLPGFVLRARPSGVHSWRVQLASRRWLTLGRLEEVSLADARAGAQVRRAQAALGEAIPRRNSASHMTLRKFLDETYEPWMKATYGRRTGQVERIRTGFRDLLDLKLTEFTTARIERWRTTRKYRNANADAPTWMRSRELSAATIHNNIASLRAALNRATEWGVVETMPLGKIKRRAADENAVVRYLSTDEEARLRASLAVRDGHRRTGRESANAWRRERGYEEFPPYGHYSDHVTPLVLLALNTGLRRGELLRLQWRDVDLDRRVVTVRGEDAKTGQTRHVPLNSEAATVATVWKSLSDSDGYVFVSSDDSQPLSYIRKAWTGILDAALVKHFRFHDLRHTFASNLVMGGVDINTVRELLGHKSIAMTLRYAHLAPEHKAAAVEVLVTRERAGQAA
jgi:integrase